VPQQFFIDRVTYGYWAGREKKLRKSNAVGTEDGRLSDDLATMLKPQLRNALDHPVRREVLRALCRGRGPRSVVELDTELRGYRRSQLGYHLQVLCQSGSVASSPVSAEGSDHVRYASEVHGDRSVQAVLRATEGGDRERREAAAAAESSSLLTMFRVPRRVRTIRLRGRGGIDSERES